MAKKKTADVDERFEKFLAKVKTLDVAVQTYLNHNTARSWDPPKNGFFLAESWTTGGLSGGSCWGGEPDTGVQGEREPEFRDFDTILEHFYRAVTFLAYKRLTAELVHYADYTENEHYGNYYHKAEKWIDLKELFEVLSREKNTTIWEE
jgi:hypothetical protein